MLLQIIIGFFIETLRNQRIVVGDRYCQQQRVLDVASKALLNDDMRRREREAKERQEEKDILETLYKVSKTPVDIYISFGRIGAGLRW